MKFRTLNSIDLEVEDEQLDNSVERLLFIIGESNDEYRLRSASGIELDMPKDIIIANNIELFENRILFTESLYHNWVKKEEDVQLLHLSQLLRVNFSKLVAHREVILNNGAYFLIELPGIFTGYFEAHLCLGGWLEAYPHFKADVADDELYVININGNPMSGRHSWQGWSAITGEVSIHSDNLKNKGVVIQQFESQSKLYSKRIRFNLPILQQLIKDLKI